MTVERVYSILNFYDGPKEGIADYAGQPHHYLYEWDEALDDYAETFSLAPVDANTMKIALEQWNICESGKSHFTGDQWLRGRILRSVEWTLVTTN